MSETNVEEKTEVQSSAQHDPSPEPIVVNLKQKKKRKRRYSRGLEEIQQMEPHLTRSTHRMSKAIEKGIATYRKRRKVSARKMKDGAIINFIPDSAWAMSRALEEASPIPYDIARAMTTKRSRKRIRRQVRMVSRTVRAMDW
jgi:hypothetical protein